MARQTAYYDREAGIVFITVIPRRRRRGRGYVAYSDERGWGLIDHAEGDGEEVCGIEIWRPEEMFPADLLDALPHPTLSRWTRLWLWWSDRRSGG